MELNSFIKLYTYLIQHKIVKTLPNSFVEFMGDPIFSSFGKILPYNQKNDIIYSDIHFTAPWGFASGWADSYRKMRAIASLGAGGVISKTITFKPKKGNPFPRFVRWQDHIINSMGLPNNGLAWWLSELQKQPVIPENFLFSIKGNTEYEWKLLTKGIGKYTKTLELNFSCPNVEAGIIDISKSLDLLTSIRKAAKDKKLFLKISPEYDTKTIIDLVKVTKEKNLIDGVTCFNTFPIHYDYLGNPLKIGGVSGKPLKKKVFKTVKEIRKNFKNSVELPIFGLGGVWTVHDALELYKKYDTFPFLLTALLIQGPFLFRNWSKELSTISSY